MSLTREQHDALQSANVGILHWNPPRELEELAGGRRGNLTGFHVTTFGHGGGVAPRVRSQTVSPSVARTIAGMLDEVLTYEAPFSGRPRTALEWVDLILSELPPALNDAVRNAEQRVSELRALQANTEGLNAGLRARQPVVSDDLAF